VCILSIPPCIALLQIHETGMNMRNLLLFVDDDEKVLEYIKSQLSHMDNEWEMVFSEGGNDAIELLREKSFSVIVSDVNNQNEDGLHLMEHVKEEFPNVARVILSSNLKNAQLNHAADHRNFYLLKGCTQNEFVAAIQEAILLHTSLLEHPRPLSTEELTEILVDYFKREILFRKLTLNDVPELIRPYLSRALIGSAIKGDDTPFLEEDPFNDQPWIADEQ
jgi:DNA-binding NarL/FixJ family response regulator